ncbi:hypothetical protein V6U77_15680 [Micromonospora sp. CPCC 205546]|uniref:hypothetical protein n=1 Tax=Micromonospora sp. CPCC 205546 TaxID=3122397 RepID=UPI002FF1CCB9
MADRSGSGRRYRVAALLAGAVALGLVAWGWWLRDWEYRADRGRFLDPGWWAGVATSGLGHLAFGRTGFKIALVALGLTAAALVGLRRRRAAGAAPSEDRRPDPGAGD